MGSHILLKGSKMFPLWTLGFALLIFGSTTACAPAVGTNAAPRNDCYRKDCNGAQYDIQEATCCENKLHPGASLSCCGKDPYNPGIATCCKVQHNNTITASVTHGLSEKVSKCCDLKAYNPINEICCQSTITARPAPMAKCCGKEAFDEDKQLCCGPMDNKKVLVKNSSDHQCCIHDQFDNKTQCCCEKEDGLEIQPKNSVCCAKDSAAPAEAFDKDKQLCCGPNDKKKVLVKNSSDHQCCGHDQFDQKTHCCCEKEKGVLEIQPKNSVCCAKDSAAPAGVKQQIVELQHNCTHLCGSSCYDPKDRRCCERNQTPHQFRASDESKATANVYDPRTHICCDGRVSERKPWIDQCCGETPYGLSQRGVLCCNNTLYKDREDGEECSETGIPYNPAKGTMCCSQFHGSTGQHCCGTEIYQPHAEICCRGHRHLKSENNHCCGVKAYNINETQMKCCAGTLYNLTSLGKHKGDAQCCGSILQKPQDICCSSEDKEVLYSAQTGFRCCGHLYYNTTLWSCCAGRLRSIHEPGQDQRKMINESRLLSVNNLNKTDLCKKLYIGTVESVSLHSIVFRSVLKIRGEANVKALPLPHVLNTGDRCSSPKLIPGKTYFFNEGYVITDFNHDSVLQSLHFIISKCSS